MNFEIKNTCCFSGHRMLSENFNDFFLEQTILQAISNGYQTFLVGMAIGFDMKCFSVLEKLRVDNNIKIVSCIPFIDQAEGFSAYNQKEYYRMIKSADEQIFVSSYYYKGCMQKRNRFMVDNSSLLIAYLKKNEGGTFSTVKYAEKIGKNIILI